MRKFDPIYMLQFWMKKILENTPYKILPMENLEGNSALLNHFCYFFQIRTFQKSRDSRSVSRMILSLCPVPSWTQCGPDPRPQWIPMNPNGSQWIPDHNVVTLSTWWPFLGQWHFTRRVVFIFKSVNDLQALQFRNTTVSGDTQFPELDWEKSAKMHHLVLGAMHKQSRH